MPNLLAKISENPLRGIEFGTPGPFFGEKDTRFLLYEVMLLGCCYMAPEPCSSQKSGFQLKVGFSGENRLFRPNGGISDRTSGFQFFRVLGFFHLFLRPYRGKSDEIVGFSV